MPGPPGFITKLYGEETLLLERFLGAERRGGPPHWISNPLLSCGQAGAPMVLPARWRSLEQQ